MDKLGCEVGRYGANCTSCMGCSTCDINHGCRKCLELNISHDHTHCRSTYMQSINIFKLINQSNCKSCQKYYYVNSGDNTFAKIPFHHDLISLIYYLLMHLHYKLAVIYIKPCNAISIYVIFLIFEAKHLFLECSPHCRTNSCDDSRHCTDGCKKGYWRQTCDTACSSHCIDNTCSPLDGKCTTGCQSGHWGDTCNSTCPPNCNEQTCSRDDGRCSSCKSNWTGDRCDGKL